MGSGEIEKILVAAQGCGLVRHGLQERSGDPEDFHRLQLEFEHTWSPRHDLVHVEDGRRQALYRCRLEEARVTQQSRIAWMPADRTTGTVFRQRRPAKDIGAERHYGDRIFLSFDLSLTRVHNA